MLSSRWRLGDSRCCIGSMEKAIEVRFETRWEPREKVEERGTGLRAVELLWSGRGMRCLEVHKQSSPKCPISSQEKHFISLCSDFASEGALEADERRVLDVAEDMVL